MEPLQMGNTAHIAQKSMIFSFQHVNLSYLQLCVLSSTENLHIKNYFRCVVSDV